MNILESEIIIERRSNLKSYEDRQKELIRKNSSQYTERLSKMLREMKANYEDACKKYFAAKEELEKLFDVFDSFDGKVFDKRFRDAVLKAGNFGVTMSLGREHVAKCYEQYRYTAYLVFPIVIRYPESVEAVMRNGNKLTGLPTEVISAYSRDTDKKPRIDAGKSKEMFASECRKIEGKIEEYKHYFSEEYMKRLVDASRKIEGEAAGYKMDHYGMPKLDISISAPNNIDFLLCFTPYGYN